MTVVLCPGLMWWVMAVWRVLAIADPCQSLLLRPLHRYAVFSCAAYLGKLSSVMCCSELCYTVHWLLAVCKMNPVCILFSVESALELFGRRQFCGCPLDDVAAWCSSVDLLCVWRLQAPQLPLTQTLSYRETLWQWVYCLAIGILKGVSIPTPVLTTWPPHHW